MECIRDFDGCGSRGKAAYTDVTHPLNPQPVRGTFVGTRKEIRFWSTVSIKLYVIAIFYIGIVIFARLFGIWKIPESTNHKLTN